jgi:hypothetical protein
MNGENKNSNSFLYFLSLREEKIIASAIQLTNGQIFVGKRHSDAQKNAKEILGEDKYLKEKIIKDGFLTTLLRFVGREEAYIIAKNNGQFKRYEIQKACGVENGYDGEELYSEDLWGGIGMEEFKKILFEKIECYDPDPGFLSPVDEYLEMFIGKDDLPYFNWIYDLYRENYDNEQFVVKLLLTLAHIPAQKIENKTVTIAKESLNRESCDIKESAVMAFENWEYVGAIPFLEKVRFNDSFLDNYLQMVIRDLKWLFEIQRNSKNKNPREGA